MGLPKRLALLIKLNQLDMELYRFAKLLVGLDGALFMHVAATSPGLSRLLPQLPASPGRRMLAEDDMAATAAGGAADDGGGDYAARGDLARGGDGSDDDPGAQGTAGGTGAGGSAGSGRPDGGDDDGGDDGADDDGEDSEYDLDVVEGIGEASGTKVVWPACGWIGGQASR